MKHKKVIIGGGITGLVLSYYLDLPIVCNPEDIGGQLSAKDWHLGPRFLQVDSWSERLLDDLNLSKKQEEITIGFDNDGACIKDDEFRQKYFEKTRKTKDGFVASSLSGGNDSFKSFKVSLTEIISELKDALMSKKNMLIPNMVTNIDVKGKVLALDNGETIEYDEVISTIPASVFNKISTVKLKGEFKCLPKVFVLTDVTPNWDFTYKYFAGSEDFHRVTKQDGKCVVEYTDFTPDEMDSEIDRATLWVGQIQENEEVNILEGIQFVGRYAEWRHNFLINDAVKAALVIGNNHERTK